MQHEVEAETQEEAEVVMQDKVECGKVAMLDEEEATKKWR